MMADVMAGQAVAEQAEVIRGLCEKGMSEGADIWEAMEANGIHVTLGVIYQAMGASGKPPQEAAGERFGEAGDAQGANGLTAEDLEALARIARKAGGVESLVRVLGKMRRMLQE